jgi:hypothetical protein
VKALLLSELVRAFTLQLTAQSDLSRARGSGKEWVEVSACDALVSKRLAADLLYGVYILCLQTAAEAKTSVTLRDESSIGLKIVMVTSAASARTTSWSSMSETGSPTRPDMASIVF